MKGCDTESLSSSGIICVDNIFGIPVFVDLVEGRGVKNVRTFQSLNSPTYCVVHTTGNTAKSANARMHASYLQNVENLDEEYVSFPLVVDEDCIYQTIPIFEMCYHCSNRWGNKHSVGIEICVNGNIEKAIDNAMKLIVWLRSKGIFINYTEYLKPHRYFANNKKLCPEPILVSEANWLTNWGNFVNDVVEKEKVLLMDNTPDKWAEPYVKRALDSGVLKGDENGSLNLHEKRTTQDILAMVYRIIDAEAKND